MTFSRLRRMEDEPITVGTYCDPFQIDEAEKCVHIANFRASVEGQNIVRYIASRLSEEDTAKLRIGMVCDARGNSQNLVSWGAARELYEEYHRDMEPHDAFLIFTIEYGGSLRYDIYQGEFDDHANCIGIKHREGMRDTHSMPKFDECRGDRSKLVTLARCLQVLFARDDIKLLDMCVLITGSPYYSTPLFKRGGLRYRLECYLTPLAGNYGTKIVAFHANHTHINLSFMDNILVLQDAEQAQLEHKAMLYLHQQHHKDIEIVGTFGIGANHSYLIDPDMMLGVGLNTFNERFWQQNTETCLLEEARKHPRFESLMNDLIQKIRASKKPMLALQPPFMSVHSDAVFKRDLYRMFTQAMKH